MTDIAKWAWVIFICILWGGNLIFYVVPSVIAFWLLLVWLKPEWFK